MNSQQLFYFNLIIGLIFIAYFFFGRSKQKSPTKLNLRAVSDLSVESKNQQISEPKQLILDPEPELVSTSSSSRPSKQATKELSIFFMYNGHDWEAHEVLGIPQGASVEVATKAYQAELKKSDPSSYEFLESAHSAIFKKRRNERL